MTRKRRHAGILAVLALLCGVAAACGIPVDSSPRAIDHDALPKALNASTTSIQPGTGSVVTLTIFLVRTRGNSESVTPELIDDVPFETDDVAQARILLTRLIAEQPSASSGTPDLTNAIPPTVKILDAKLDGGVLELDVSKLDAVEGTQQRLAFAEIVFTATGISGIDSVRFMIAGLPAQVPIDNSTSKAGQAITRADYHQLDSGS